MSSALSAAGRYRRRKKSLRSCSRACGGGLFRLGKAGIALAAFYPFGDAVFDVARIGEEGHFARFLEGGEGTQGSRELHAIIGGDGFSLADLLPALFVAEDGGPAAGPGISL